MSITKTTRQFIVPIAIIVILASISLSTTHNNPPLPTTPTVSPMPQVITPSEVASLVNAERQKAGLAPLVEDGRLDASATDKCADMVKLDEHDHDLRDGTTPFTFIQAHVDHYLTAGENLSWNYDSAPAAVAGLMNSPGHRANILNTSYTNVGYAVCNSASYHNMIVQQFIGI